MPVSGLRDQTTEAILGCAFEVSNALGHGFLEAVYRRALAREFAYRNIPFSEETSFPVTYRGSVVGHYVADLVVADRVIVELKAVDGLVPAHYAQILNYLNASQLSIGLLINFGRPRIEYKRIIR